MSNHRRPERPLNLLLLKATAVTLVALGGGCATPTHAPAELALAGRKPLTFEAVYGSGRIDFNGHYARGLGWSHDGRHIHQRVFGTRQKIDPVSGDAEPLYDVGEMRNVLAAHEDFDSSAAGRLARDPTLFNQDRSRALLDHDNRLYLYDFDAQTVVRITAEPQARRLLTFSPDESRVAYVSDNNLFAVDTAGGAVRQLTNDGSDTILNGVLDWVYQEEIYGRGDWRAYWWSGDGDFIAYLRLDETDVPVHTIVDHMPTRPAIDRTHYPKAGDPNPLVGLGIVRPDGGQTVWVDLHAYEGIDLLIVGVDWSPDGQVVYCVQDREARWLHLNEADPQTGESRNLLHETTPAWTDHFGMPLWLDDGSFLWRSARDGWRHLYHYDREGQLASRLTEGEWEVRRLNGYDPNSGYVYFSGTRDSHTEEHAYRVPLAGGAVERLTEPGHTHAADFDPRFRYFIDTFSNLTTPTQVHLRGTDGGLVRVISENEIPALEEYELSTPEIVRVPTSHGHELNAIIIRPPNMQPGRKYPVMTITYAGPHAPSVHNRWAGRHYASQQLLASMGYIVWICDPYSASGEGEISAWHAYKRLGITELEDLEDSIRWLAENEQADLDRVGIYGSSYGGYMAAFALTHGTLFDLGIAESALVDWRNYDTIYTERYMQTPANNPEGYQLSSVTEAAHRLHGRLLIAHGALDDNVHVQNALQLADKLQEAGKEFELMIYPQDGHGIYHNGEHYRRLRYEFIRKNL